MHPKKWLSRLRTCWCSLAFVVVTLLAGNSAQAQAPYCLLSIPTNQNDISVSITYPFELSNNWGSNNASYMSNYVIVGTPTVPAGYYQAWCVDYFDSLGAGPVTYTADLFASCDPNLNTYLTNEIRIKDVSSNGWNNSVYVSPATWNKVNYILNHSSKSYWLDIQWAIWQFVGGPVAEIGVPGAGHLFTNDVNALVNQANTNAANWSLSCGDVEGIVVVVEGYSKPVQLVLMSVPVPCVPGVSVTKNVACLLPGNNCGVFGKLAAGYKGLEDPAFCYEIVVSNTGNDTLTNVTVHDNMVGDITTNFFPTATSTLAPGASITNFFKLSWDVTTTNTVTVSGAAAHNHANVVTASDSAVAQVDTAAVTCTVTLNSACDLDGNPNDSNVLLPGCGGVCPVTFKVQVCNPSAVNLTNVTITSAALSAMDCSLPAPFNLPAGTCINYQCTASLTCPGAPLNVNVSVVGHVLPDATHCGYDITSTNTVVVSSTCNGLVQCAPGTAALSGFLFLDCGAAAGAANPANPGTGLAGYTVNLLNAASNQLATTVSAANGAYSFTNLSFASYIVQIQPPTNVVAAYDTDGVLDNQTVVAVANCAGANFVNFGYADQLTARVNSGTNCAGSALTMTATVAGQTGPFTYAWSGPAGFSAATASISASAAGTYNVTVTDTNGCTVAAAGTLTLNPLPVVTVNSGAVPQGSSLTMTATVTSGTGPFTYAWTGPSGFTAATASISVGVAGVYAVTVVDHNGCSAGGSGTLTVNPVPKIALGDAAVCAGGAATLTPSTSSGTSPFTYAWTGPNSFTATTMAVTVTNAGIYNVTVTDANGYTATARGHLTVYPQPVVTANGGAVCAGDSLTIAATVSSGTAPFAYVWSGPGGFILNDIIYCGSKSAQLCQFRIRL